MVRKQFLSIKFSNINELISHVLLLTGWLLSQSGRFCITFAKTSRVCCTKTRYELLTMEACSNEWRRSMPPRKTSNWISISSAWWYNDEGCISITGGVILQNHLCCLMNWRFCCVARLSFQPIIKYSIYWIDVCELYLFFCLYLWCYLWRFLQVWMCY